MPPPEHDWKNVPQTSADSTKIARVPQSSNSDQRERFHTTNYLPSSSHGNEYHAAELSSPAPSIRLSIPPGVPRKLTPSIDYSASPSEANYRIDRNLEQPSAAQQSPLTDSVAFSPNLFLPSSGDNSRSPSPLSLEKDFEQLRGTQNRVPLGVDGHPRTPSKHDFPRSLSMSILKPGIDEHSRTCMILLHQHGNSETSLKDLSLRLQKTLKDCTFILLRAPQAIQRGNSGYHWADEEGGWDGPFHRSSAMILMDVIKGSLIEKCRYRPQDIVILGYKQGGMVALASAASWNAIELGGVISIGGPKPSYAHLPATAKARTPTLILGASFGNISDTALQQIQQTFIHVDPELQPGTHDEIPQSEDELKPLLDFLGHRLGREEWNKQAVISFDGGGIRGYGSLLILQALMNKIGNEEKRIDAAMESSFSPCAYRPTVLTKDNMLFEGRPSLRSDGFDRPDTAETIASPTEGLRNSSLFLPCHYFTYAAGTSTGGLISIMLQRLRMTVDECIKEYKTLGEQVFGHPRSFSKGAILRQKFDHRALEKAVQDVTTKYGEPSEYQRNYAMESINDDMCRCLVLAYSDIGGGDAPYLFRTYRSPVLSPLERSQSKMAGQQTTRNFGEPSALPIWEVARATSAAPNYFRPITIKRGNGRKDVTFKDGGFGSNNPSETAYKDVIRKHDGKGKNMGPFISIGTGITPLNMFPKKPGNVNDFLANVKTAFKLPARTVTAHENMSYFSTRNKEEAFPYFRFDGGSDLGQTKMDEWKSHKLTSITGRDTERGYKTLDKIFTATARYLAQPEVQLQLTNCAHLLVRRRRLRTRDASRWDRYASFSYYECDIACCEKPPFSTANDFREHLRASHHFQLAYEAMELKVRQCRHCHWIYDYRPNSAVPKRAVSTFSGKDGLAIRAFDYTAVAELVA